MLTMYAEQQTTIHEVVIYNFKICFIDFRHQKRLVKMLGKIENSVIADSVMESPEDRPNVQTGRKPASRPVKASTDTPLQARRSLNQVLFVFRNFMFLALSRKSCV